MNYESEALIFYHDYPEENIRNLTYFLQNRLSHNYLGSKSKNNILHNFLILVLSENLLSLFVLNDNVKITRLLKRLIVIYSRSIKRIKLKYFFQYYNNVVFSDYIKYQKLQDMFKRKRIQYQKYSKNNKSKNLYNNNSNFRTINTPSQYSYIMNCSEPIIIRPSNNNLAFLMTPCYIIDNPDIKYRNIYEYGKKCLSNVINKCNLTSRHQFGNNGQENKDNAQDYIFNDNYFNEISSELEKKIDKSFSGKNNLKKISFPIHISKLNGEKGVVERNENKRKNFENKRAISSNKPKRDKNRYNYLYSDEFRELDFNLNNKKNSLYLAENNFVNNSKKKMNNKKKNRSCILSETNLLNLNHEKLKNGNNQINREIFSHLYNNNYLNNLKKIDAGKTNKEKSIKNKNSISEINTERRQKNYRIFERNDNPKLKKVINDSHEYILKYSINNNRKTPYNKIIKNGIISSGNFSLLDNSGNKKNLTLGINFKKINKTSSINNSSNNSNSQSNNQNINHISTNYSIKTFNKENQKIIKKKREDNKENLNIQNELRSKNQIIQDNIEKNTNTSNRISLQSLSDSKMMELAGHYGYEDSSSENYQMNNIIHNKKKFHKKNN